MLRLLVCVRLVCFFAGAWFGNTTTKIPTITVRFIADTLCTRSVGGRPQRIIVCHDFAAFVFDFIDLVVVCSIRPCLGSYGRAEAPPGGREALTFISFRLGCRLMMLTALGFCSHLQRAIANVSAQAVDSGKVH